MSTLHYALPALLTLACYLSTIVAVSVAAPWVGRLRSVTLQARS